MVPPPHRCSRQRGRRLAIGVTVLALLLALGLPACSPCGGPAEPTSAPDATERSDAGASDASRSVDVREPGTADAPSPRREGGVLPPETDITIPSELPSPEAFLAEAETRHHEHLASLRGACAANALAEDCIELHWRELVLGQGVDAPNPGAAFPAFERLCEAGLGDACSNLAYLLTDHDYGRVDRERAAALLARACELESGRGCNNLGWYLHGTGELGPTNPTAALDLYARACDLEYSAGCTNLALGHLEGRGTRVDPEAAIAALRRGCDMEDANACNDLAWFGYHEGRGTALNPARALELFEWSCHAGNAVSCNSAGFYFMDGLAGQTRPERALAYYHLSCAMNAPVGCASAGALYLRGEHVPQDVERALELLERGCEGGIGWACDIMQGFPR